MPPSPLNNVVLPAAFEQLWPDAVPGAKVMF